MTPSCGNRRRYGLPGFVVDVRAFLREPMAVLSTRARQQLPDDPLEVAATSPAELPLRVRRSLQSAKPSRSVLIRIDDDAPAERLQIRWQAALRICEPLLRGRPWRVVSLAPGLSRGWRDGRCPPQALGGCAGARGITEAGRNSSGVL